MMIDATWLRALGPAGLAALLERRPDGLAAPPPASLAELADRLNQPLSVLAALRRLSRPTIQVAEALAALGGEVDRNTLDRLLGAAPGTRTGAGVPTGGDRAAAVDRALDTLYGYGLLVDRDRPTLIDPVRAAWEAPLGLGVPVAVTLRHQNAEELRRRARELGLRPAGRKADRLAQLLDTYRDAELIRRIVAAAPPAARELLTKSAMTGEPATPDPYSPLSPAARRPGPVAWALARGLLARVGGWDGRFLVPAEVALALRGPDWTAPFDVVPPRPSTVPVAAEAVARDSAASGSAALRLVSALADEAGRAPFAVLKAGGVGVREIRRLAKLIGVTDPEVRLGLAVAEHAGLLAAGPDGIIPTPGYDRWLRGEPADRLAALLAAWWRLPAVPTADADTAWMPRSRWVGAADLRATLLREARALSGGEQSLAVADPAGLADLVLWTSPLVFGEPRSAAPLVAACWAEAALLGAVGAGTVSAAGRALIAGTDLAASLTDLGGTERRVRIQADLTAVVTGTPSAELAELLDAAADRQSRGTASTWRFTPASVRRAMDAGARADTLLTDLAAVATGDLPQPLAYLVNDVARRHGAVRAQDVACCLRADDTALLAEIAADRRLRALGLRVLAPTVLASGEALAQTLAALRDAGYAPLAERADGTPVLERTAPRRAGGSGAGRGRAGGAKAGGAKAGAAGGGGRAGRSRTGDAPARPTPADLARDLLSRSDEASGPRSRSLPAVRAGAPQLSPGPARILAHAIDTGTPVRIDYVNQAGNVSSRVIEEIELSGGSMFAWCRLRQDERMFNLTRILAVTPAGSQ